MAVELSLASYRTKYCCCNVFEVICAFWLIPPCTLPVTRPREPLWGWGCSKASPSLPSAMRGWSMAAGW